MHSFALSLLVLAGLSTAGLASTDTTCSGPNARTTPPPDAIVVDITGVYNGSYQSMAEGIAYLPNTTDEHTIFVFPGLYQEQVLIPRLAGPLVLQGYTCDTTSYAGNKVTITHTMAQRDLPPEIKNSRNDLISTMRLKSGSGVKMYNINVANPSGKIEKQGQAIAVYVDNTNYGFYGCNFTGYQDTLCAHKGRELYSHSYISGAVDFIFGMLAKAWFESCDFETVGKGWITANGNTNSSNLSEYVFNNARVFNTNTSMNGTTYLGRPWRPYARVVWQNSELSDVVNPKGWDTWKKGDNNTADVYFKEFNNTGPGAAIDQRASFSGQLNASVPITDILGEGFEAEWWVDTTFL
ncbi:Pectinesterase [Phytophthora megakarya]|uniref:Pectinesterase n=1 Tax=Phytophthora megakarya TaxID=4795 RepID=A0A225VCU5_9STRA|nr:Pectinesterase [Phytophthora megakarya]